MKIKIYNGVDIVKVERISKNLDKHRDSFLKKICTPGEISYIEEKNYRPETVAGLFAAKEAVSKMLGTGIGQVGFKDIEVKHLESGKPYVDIMGKLEEKMQDLGIDNIELSISHEKDYALAFAIGY